MGFELFVPLGATRIFKPQPFAYAVPCHQIRAQFRTRAEEDGVSRRIVIDRSFAQAIFLSSSAP